MQDRIGVPTTCLFSSSSGKLVDDGHHDPTTAAATRPGQTAVTSTYRTKIAGRCRLITVTWYRDLLLRRLTVSAAEEGDQGESGRRSDRRRRSACKVELKPWSFWRRQGSKRLVLAGGGDDEGTTAIVTVWWDLRAARFRGETEPESGYYVAVATEDEVVLLLGDMKDEAYKKTGTSRQPGSIDPSLVSKREHVFGKRKFSTRAKFHDKGKLHEISIECKNNKTVEEVSSAASNVHGGVEPEMEIRLDGQLLVHVKHLQWKFRGNESIHVNKVRVEVFWDVHDWLFSPGLRHALFIFKPAPAVDSAVPSSLSSSTSSSLSSSESFESLGSSGGSSSEFCLFLYAWKVE